ncbi:MAG TPA: tetratricopeptide repeat protein [Stellaceae bacterium]|nr:tetratricopeptide repeat protein [Stellaceae bacterium]
MSDIFREIDEELRRDNLLKLWKLYGRYVIAAAVVALLVAGGIVAWRNHELAQRQAQSVRYEAGLALLRQGKEAEAAKIFASVGEEGGSYANLAAFEAAALAAKSGDVKGAVADYDKLAASPDLDPELRNAAMLLSAMNGFADSDPQKVIERLKPLTAGDSPWRYSALDLTAAARLKAGDDAGALEIYKQLAADSAAPEGVRGRAAEMAAVLKP